LTYKIRVGLFIIFTSKQTWQCLSYLQALSLISLLMV